MFKFQQEMTKSYYEKILPANVHIFYEQGNMIDVKKHKSFGNFLFNKSTYSAFVERTHSIKTFNCQNSIILISIFIKKQNNSLRL